MSRTGQKRAKAKDLSRLSRKRRKLETTPQKPFKSTSSSGASVATRSANELVWREVTPPERLDDAEGFLGLEEIDDVEVVRDAKGKQTYFRVCSFTSCSIQHLLINPFC